MLRRLRRIVENHGDAPAIWERGQLVYDYHSLWQHAHTIARAIPSQELVGLYIKKSPQYIAAMLGCWLAGAAFVPLDPDLPVDRLDYMIRNAQIKTLLYHRQEPHFPLRSVPLPSPTKAAPVELPEQNRLAYVIYTSGSSGEPKGVMVGFAGLLPMLEAQIEAFGLGSDKRSLFMLSTNFDASVSDIGTALLSGASLFLEYPQDLLPGPNLLSILSSRRITHVDMPPALLPLLEPESLSDSLETIIFGGEVCDPAVVRRHQEHRRLVCVYGPTEATICTSMVTCNPQWDRPLLGDPTPQVTYTVENDELFIAGPCLAWGYLGKPALTATRFLPSDGGRRYASGDLVRRDPDGGLVFLGRKDRQLKLQGRLIAPEEIEFQLLQAAGVQQAVVTIRELDWGKELVAHVVARDVFADELKALLSDRLPPWMLPQQYIFMERLPTTASGKTDLQQLKKLPSPAQPTSLAKAWCDILGVDQAKAADNFFELGGNSIAVIRLCIQVPTLTPATVFQHPTYSDLRHQLADKAPGKTLAQLREMVQSIPPRPIHPQRPKKILVTGASGFFGSHLVSLLKDTYQVFCLVHREPVPQGVTTLNGSIQEDRLGLSRHDWQQLTTEIDTIYHCAARVDMAAPLEQLADVNLEGTRRILEFAQTGRPKAIHYIGSLAVLLSGTNTQAIDGQSLPAETETIHGGYAQSKLLAELLLKGHASIYRLGLLVAWQRNDLLNLFLRSIKQLGFQPDPLPQGFIDLTPVHFAAEALVSLSLTQMIEGRRDTLVIANPTPCSLKDLLAPLHLKRVDPSSFRTVLNQASHEAKTPETIKGLLCCRELLEPPRGAGQSLFGRGSCSIDMSDSLQQLQPLCCPNPQDIIAEVIH